MLGDGDQAELLLERALYVGRGERRTFLGFVDWRARTEVAIDGCMQLQVGATELRPRGLVREGSELLQLLDDHVRRGDSPRLGMQSLARFAW